MCIQLDWITGPVLRCNEQYVVGSNGIFSLRLGLIRYLHLLSDS